MADTVLTVRNIIKKYGDHTVLDNLSLEVTKGEVVVIVGPSGCGKSTLLRCINGLESIQSGSISSDGRAGMVFQSYELFPHLNVLKNMMLAPVKVQKREKKEVKKEAMELLTRVGLEEKADSYPLQLSGGQKQRVAIVRALILHPEILLFDEVTAALDPEMVRDVLDVVLDLARQKRTMLVVTHEMQFARAAADRIVFMDEGKIIEEASSEEFFEHPKTERAKRFLNVFRY